MLADEFQSMIHVAGLNDENAAEFVPWFLHRDRR
jgi:hypothetical protein